MLNKMAVTEDSMLSQYQSFGQKFHFGTGVDPPDQSMVEIKKIKIRIRGRKEYR